jgi:crossover junction endodeoxyribonuclease RuvC
VFVLGIDPGLTTTGYGVMQDRPLAAIGAGVIRTDPHLPPGDRLAELFRRLGELISEHRPHVMAIEQVFTNLNLQTAVAVGRASGVAILAAALSDVPVFEYTPTMVKATVTGDGGAAKKAVASMLARRLRLSSPPSPADAADALAVALCHIQTCQFQTARIGAPR